VSGRFCPFCGQPVVAGGTYCPSCGAALSGAPPPTSGAGAFPSTPGLGGATPFPSYAPYPPGYGAAPGVPNPASRPADVQALSNVSIAAILALVGAIVGLALFFTTNAASIIGVSTGASGTSFSLSLSTLYLLIATSGISIVLTILELVFYRSAFHTLAPHDSRFSTPASLVLLALIAILIIVAAAAYLVYGAYEAILCAGSGHPVTSACFSVGTLLGLVAIVGVAAVLALIGWIGLLIGIWRLGSRYNESLFKVGAVLLIFPVLNVVAVILILVAARSARARIEGGATSLNFG
jgi:uncharacterized membrane protein